MSSDFTASEEAEVTSILGDLPAGFARATPRLWTLLAARLPAILDPLVSMPHVHDQRYWRRSCEEGHGWSVDLAAHGGSWKQAFAELWISSALRSFGVYPEQPPSWDIDMARPPMDARHPFWGTAHPGAPLVRVDGTPNRERFCANAMSNPDVDERITASSNTGWPYLERLKSAVRSRTTACFPGTSPTLRVAWAEGIDKVVHVAACEAAIEAASKPTLYFAAAAASATAATATSGAAKGKGGKSSAAAPPASVAPSAASLLGIDPDVLLPSSVRISRNRRAAVAAVQAHEDLFDCAILPLVTQGSVAAMAGAWPLREWVSPQTHAEWVATTAWPRERAHSVLMLRVIELREFLDRVTACEDYVFSLFLGGGDAGCVGGGGLPSHLDIEVVLSRLPNCARLELCYGVLDRAVAPLSGFALPLEDDDEDGSSGRAGLASLVVPPDAVVAGMLPHDLLPLTRCLRATTSLTTLVLSRNNLDDALTAQLASALAINSTVCELNVSHNLIGSAGMEALARLFLHSYAGGRRCMITRLDVSHNAGDARAGAAFASALRACPTLQQLVLSRNALGDGGASAVLAAVAGHTGCKHLELAGCGLGAAAAATIAAALSVPGTALVTLDMSANATAWGSSSTDTSTAVAALCSAVIASQAAGVGATRLRMCNVRPAFEPAALHDALRANTLITSSSCGPLLLV